MGITSWFAVQALVNIGVTIGQMPNTGLPLPFISYGGSSLVVGMAAIGIMINIGQPRKDERVLCFNRWWRNCGHLYPGLAVAEVLVSLGKRRNEIHFFTSDREIDNKLLTAADFHFTPLEGGGLTRRNISSSIGAVILLIKSTIFAYRYVRKSKPKVILALGGFAAVPGSVAGLLTGTPVVLHEQNSVPGAANKLISKWVKKSAVSISEH
ncbi:MAG: hypothetical protein CM15mP49_01290 [Actinomycetota bacterium]|nr:MAG: hypothetical protein CM15mP49_01290 [Actinomycetota bacterium]